MNNLLPLVYLQWLKIRGDLFLPEQLQQNKLLKEMLMKIIACIKNERCLHGRID